MYVHFINNGLTSLYQHLICELLYINNREHAYTLKPDCAKLHPHFEYFQNKILDLTLQFVKFNQDLIVLIQDISPVKFASKHDDSTNQISS